MKKRFGHSSQRGVAPGPITLGCPDIYRYLLIIPKVQKTRLVDLSFRSRFVALHGTGLTPDQFPVGTLYDLITKQVGPISITPKFLSNDLDENRTCTQLNISPAAYQRGFLLCSPVG